MPAVSKKRAAELVKPYAVNTSNHPIIALVYAICDTECDTIEAKIGAASEDFANVKLKIYKLREDKNGKSFFGNGFHTFYLEETLRIGQ